MPQLAAFARALADEAGARLIMAVEEPRAVRWKVDTRRDQRSAVSDLDDALEVMLRTRIREAWPRHAIVGEELADEPPARGEREAEPYTWVLDPIDGTSNFTNGLPLYAVSVGVLRGATPVAGAIWCASTPQLRPATYHAALGGVLCMDGAPARRLVPHAVRGIVTEPGSRTQLHAVGDGRVFGSAATECAWVAAGALRAIRLGRPRVWDVAAGIVLARAAGCTVLTRRDDMAAWEPFVDFVDEGRHLSHEALREWSRPLLIAQIGTEFAPPAEVHTRP